jgi:hypothetical protein
MAVRGVAHVAAAAQGRVIRFSANQNAVWRTRAFRARAAIATTAAAAGTPRAAARCPLSAQSGSKLMPKIHTLTDN